MEYVTCDLCGLNEVEIIFTGAGWQQPVPEGCTLVRCRKCGLMYLNPRPNPDEIGDYYPSDYKPYQSATEDESFWLMGCIRQRKLVQRRRYVEKFSGRQTGSILDVGCSTGLFLHEMQQRGWQTFGVEPTSSAAEYARSRFGLNIINGHLADTSFPLKSFDVITFWDVLEHTFSPTTELAHAAKLLKPDGKLALNIPNYRCPDRRLFGPHWIGYDPPRHLYVFTRVTLTALLKKTGFMPVQWLCFMSSYFSFVVSLEAWLKYYFPGLAKLVCRVLNFPGTRYLFEPYFTLMNWLGFGGVIAVMVSKQTDSSCG
jgi:SAM-dependent methyltransferase